MRTDFENINEGNVVRLFPNDENPLHKTAVVAQYLGGYFYVRGSDPMNGPDYYFGDIVVFNDGFEVIE